MPNNHLKKKIEIIVEQFKQKKFLIVIEKSKKLLLKNPNIDFLTNIIGLSYLELKDYPKAEYFLLETINKNPSNIAAKNNYGMLLQSINQIKKAEDVFLEIINNNKNHIPSLNNLANLKKDSGHYEEAISLYKKILDIDKNQIATRYNLSISLYNIRKKKEALKEAITISETDPTFTKADDIISSLTDYKFDEYQHLKSMLNKLDKLDLDNEAKIYLFFSLGKAYEDLENYKKAFEFYSLANNTANNNISFNFNDEEKIYEKITNFFLKNKSKFTFNDQDQMKIIFICGMPRSGTTLLEQIISTHKDVAGLGETNFLNLILLSNEFADGKNFLSLLSKNTEFQENTIYLKYIEYLKKFKFDQKIFTDKSLFNFMYIGFIKAFFPKSKVIILNRNFNDNLLSIFKNNLPAIKWSYNIKNIKLYSELFVRYKNFWQQHLPGWFLEINYDELVNSPEKISKQILKFCELDWDPNCLEFYNKNKTAINTASINQADKPIYKDSINKFENFRKYFEQ